jgi:hypothetical protein
LNYPELVSIKLKRTQIMKTKNFEISFDSFAVFALTNEEMITVRGGGDDAGGPVTNPTNPPVKI